MNCVIYARVSTEKQAEKELSIPAQLHASREYAKRHDWFVAEEFIDAGSSGRTTARPELNRLLTRCRAGGEGVQVVIVHKLDRLARNLADHIAIRGLLHKHHIKLVSVTENVDESVSGHLVENIMASIAEFYSANLAEEVMKGLRQRIISGGWPHRPPRGYRTERIGLRSHVVIEPEQAALVRRAFELCLEQYEGLVELRRRLARLGMRSRSGQPVSNGYLSRLLRNPFYIGRVRWKGEEHPGAQPPLISEALFQEVQNVLSSRSTWVTKSAAARHLLTGIARCHICGCFVSGEQHGRFGYYRCRGTLRIENRCRESYCRVDKANEAVERIYRRTMLPNTLRQELIRAITKDGSDHVDARRRQQQERRKRSIELDAREAHPTELFADGVITEETHRLALSRLANARLDLERSVDDTSTAQPIDHLTKLVAGCRSVWMIHGAMDLAGQRQLAELVFARVELSAAGIMRFQLKDWKASHRAA